MCSQLLNLPMHVASNFRVLLKYLEESEINDMPSSAAT